MTFFTFSGSGYVKKHTNFELTQDNYISIEGSEFTPIEDYGDYLLTEEILTDSQAWEKWLNLI